MNRRALRVGTLAATIGLAICQSSCLAGSRALTAGHDSTTSIGTASIYIYGRLGDIVLVDPLGRRDEDSTRVGGIPECSRWPGGIEHELDDPDTSDVDIMLFQLPQCLPGRYELLGTAEDSVDVRISVAFDPADQLGTGCPSINRVDRVPPGRLSWTLVATGTPSKGKCHVTILPAALVKRGGRR